MSETDEPASTEPPGTEPPDTEPPGTEEISAAFAVLRELEDKLAALRDRARRQQGTGDGSEAG